MSDEQDKLKLSLEPPKLFGRKKKSDAMGTAKGASPVPADQASEASEATPTDEPTQEVAEESVTEELDTTAPEPVAEAPVSEEPAAEATVVEEPAAEATVVEEPAAEATVVEEPAAEATTEPEPTPEPEPEPVTAPDPTPEPEPIPQKATKPPTKPAARPAATKTAATKTPVTKTARTTAAATTTGATKTTAAPAAKQGAAASASAKADQAVRKLVRPRAKLAPDIEPEPVRATELEDAEITGHQEAPILPLYPAAAVTGAVVGAAMVILTWLFLRGCESVGGTPSCGGGPGFVLLVATFVICILLGSTLLKTFDIQDPTSSSFLAVGLVAVVSLLFLIDVLDHWSMLIVIPIIGVGGFLASVWVTKTFVEPEGGT